jgi:REP element-mobilizing transposase RayT
MSRPLRIQYLGAVYHVMARGNHGQEIFQDDQDRQCFLETLGEACEKTGWWIHAHVLMGNHYHLLVETPEDNLVSGMKWVQGAYTQRYNSRHKLFGHLFSGRYKALIVDGSGTGYLRTVCDYVHLNPVRAKLLSKEQKLAGYRWSSHGEYLKRPGRRVRWLWVDRLLGEMGIPKDSAAGRKAFERRMELRRWEDQPEQWTRVRRGWCLGDEAFRKELLAQMAEKAGASHYGEELQESAEEKAQRIVVEEMRRLGWRETDLEQHRKGDRRKVKIARRLRQETTMTLKWIADRLKMGTWTHVTNRLYHRKK